MRKVSHERCRLGQGSLASVHASRATLALVLPLGRPVSSISVGVLVFRFSSEVRGQRYKRLGSPLASTHVGVGGIPQFPSTQPLPCSVPAHVGYMKSAVNLAMVAVENRNVLRSRLVGCSCHVCSKTLWLPRDSGAPCCPKSPLRATHGANVGYDILMKATRMVSVRDCMADKESFYCPQSPLLRHNQPALLLYIS